MQLYSREAQGLRNRVVSAPASVLKFLQVIMSSEGVFKKHRTDLYFKRFFLSEEIAELFYAAM